MSSFNIRFDFFSLSFSRVGITVGKKEAKSGDLKSNKKELPRHPKSTIPSVSKEGLVMSGNDDERERER